MHKDTPSHSAYTASSRFLVGTERVDVARSIELLVLIGGRAAPGPRGGALTHTHTHTRGRPARYNPHVATIRPSVYGVPGTLLYHV